MKKILILFFLLLAAPVLRSQQWYSLSGGSLNGAVGAIYDDGTYRWISGDFTKAGSMTAYHVIRHDGIKWIPTDSLIYSAIGFIEFQGSLYVYGSFFISGSTYGLMKWNGSKFIPFLKINAADCVRNAVVFQNTLVIAGRLIVCGTTSVCGIAKWDGVTWSAFPGNINVNNSTVCGTIYALYADGTRLYIGGDFDRINALPAYYFAYFELGGWHTMNAPFQPAYAQQVLKIRKYNGSLYAIGFLKGINAATDCPSILRYDGTTWNCVFGGLSMQVNGAETYDGRLYLGGFNLPPYNQAGVSLHDLGYLDNAGFHDKSHELYNLNSPGGEGVYTLSLGRDNTLYAGGTFMKSRGDAGDYIAYTNGQTALPVTLTEFSVSVCANEDNTVCISWRTELEINNAFFVVERSTDAVLFDSIATIEGSGTTTIEKTYEYHDRGLTKGIYYYRLRQVDYDGAYSVSELASVSVAENVGCNPEMFLRSENQDYELYDLLGRILKHTSEKIELASLHGFYIIAPHPTGEISCRQKVFFP